MGGVLCPGKLESSPGRFASDDDELATLLRAVTHDLRGSTRALAELPPWILQDLEKATAHSIPPSLFEMFELLMMHAHRMDGALADLSRLAHACRPRPKKVVKLLPFVEDLVASLDHRSDHQIDLSCQVHSVAMAPEDLRFLVMPLLTNALVHHDLPDGVISFAAQPSLGGVEFRVRDDGPGIPWKFRDRVFAPMTSLKPKDRSLGTGLGLTIARKVCSRYEGTIEICPMEGPRGTEVRCWLPVSET